MSEHPMTWALAGRMVVWTILALLAYAAFVLGVARFLAWLSSKYPRLYATHDEYYGHEPYGEPDDEGMNTDYSDAVEGTEPPRDAA